LVFKSGDTASLATTVCNGISDAGKRHEMACNARRVAREQFNTSIMAKRFAGLVMTLAESSGAMT
jgi:glycosyltransferase involved in cell wall biosynthesis